MPVVKIDWLEGRSDVFKQKLYDGISKTFEDLGISKEKVHIIINDVSLNNWAKGDIPMTEIKKEGL